MTDKVQKTGTLIDGIGNVQFAVITCYFASFIQSKRPVCPLKIIKTEHIIFRPCFQIGIVDLFHKIPLIDIGIGVRNDLVDVISIYDKEWFCGNRQITE